MILPLLSAFLIALIAMPLQAEPVKDYLAVYRILPLQSDIPIGEYRVAQHWDSQSKHYVQQANIAFSWRVLFRTHHYQYQDKVLYGADSSLSYTLSEDNNGKIRHVSGSRPSQATTLRLNISDAQGKRQLAINLADFDYTLFALRFPLVCRSQQIGTERRDRILIPASGDIHVSTSRYVGMTRMQLPGSAVVHHDLCLIETTGAQQEMRSQSWINHDGYLVYQIADNYRLLLVTEASYLPQNHQEKP